MAHPKLTDLVETLPSQVPFVGPETQERARGAPFLTRLGANESVFGPSPKAIAAMSKASAEAWMYPDPENHELKHALAAHHGVAPENIMVGEGIDGLLGYVCRMFVAPGVKVITSDGAYPTFNFHVSGYGGDLVKVPYVDDCESPKALLGAADGARLIYLSNPDNPMGSAHSNAVVLSMIDALPDDALLILDEAYAEFMDIPPYPMTDIRPNVLRMRTFSKAYGMAGARVGYAVGDADLITAFHKIRNHFGMSRVSVAGAIAALEDQAYLDDVLRWTRDAKARIAKIARDNGLTPLASATNFVTIECGRDGAYAQAVLAALVARGVFVRMPFVAPQNRCIRISAGKPEDLDILAEILPLALEDMG